MDWHIYHPRRKIISLNVQDKEGVENAVLRPVGLRSMEEASLHSIPSRGRNHRGVVAQGRRRWYWCGWFWWHPPGCPGCFSCTCRCIWQFQQWPPWWTQFQRRCRQSQCPREYSQCRHSKSNSRASCHRSSMICSLCYTEPGNPLQNQNHKSS